MRDVIISAGRYYLFAILLPLVLFCTHTGEKGGNYILKNVGGSTELGILAFNVLSAFDHSPVKGDDPRWLSRREEIFSVIDELSPDIATILESSSTQFEQIKEHYSSRYIIIHKHSYSPDALVMYKRERFTEIEQGFWPLDRQAPPKYRRLAVWVKLRDNDSGKELMLAGTHIDAKKLQDQEVKAIRSKLASQQISGAPLFLAGDFNINPSDRVYALFVSGGWKDSGLTDSPESDNEAKAKTRNDSIFYFGNHIEVKSWLPVSVANLQLAGHRGVYSVFSIQAAQ